MSDLACPHCQAKLSENAKFCHNCGQSVVCQGCQAPIQSAAYFCNQCGKPLPETISIHLPSSAPGILPGYNWVKVDEIGPDYQYHSNMILTNEAIGEFRDAIPRTVHAHTPISSREADNNHQHDQGAVVEMPSSEVSSVPQLPAGSSSSVTSKQHDASGHTSEEEIWKIFSRDEGNKLIQETPNLKAATKKDYAIRLAHLYLFAKHKLGADKVLRAEVFDMLEEAAVKDNNIYLYFTKEPGIQALDGGYLRLNLDGRTKAQRYIADVLNSDLPDGWLPGNEKRSPNNRGKKPSKKSGEPLSGEEASAVEWAAHEMTQNLKAAIPYKTINELNTVDQGIFGLYGISKTGTDREVFHSVIVKYLFKGFQITVSPNNLRKALARAAQGKNGYITFRDGFGYRITPTGCDYIEKKVQGGA